MRKPILALFLVFLSLSLYPHALFSQNPLGAPIQPAVPADGKLFSGTGNAAIARRYLEWAQREAAAGRSAEAIAALERGADYADASSDISYYLAFLYEETGFFRFSIADNCRLALETNRWEQYTPEDARLLLGKVLTELRLFDEALNVLMYCDSEKYGTLYNRLLAFRGLANSYTGDSGFLETMSIIMEKFPRETMPLRVLFNYAARLDPNDRLRQLVDLVLRRLPLLLETDPELGYLAAPFIYDRETARNYVAAYRALGNPRPASLVPSLNHGLISGKQAVEELFAWRGEDPQLSGQAAVLDRRLIQEINRLLQLESDREGLRRNLLQFSGVITEDRDNDGITEAWVSYKNGMIQEIKYDSNQDGIIDLHIHFERGLPSAAVVAIPPDGAPAFTPLPESFVFAALHWERYPAVLDAELNGKRYIPRPLEFLFTPVRFVPLVLGGPDYPELESSLPLITERNLVSSALIIEQPSADFPGGVERVELNSGVPVKSTTSINGKKVSETEFRMGVPFIQYLDLDMDGRMETRRRFDQGVHGRVIITESDWDGDGVYEYAETLQDDGSIKKSWDFNRDGIRETEY